MVGQEIAESEMLELDARGDQCPMPLLKAKRQLNNMDSGQQLRVVAPDKGSVQDFALFAARSGHELVSSLELDGEYIHVLAKA